MTFGTVTQAETDQSLADDRKAGNKSDSAYRTISEVAQDLNLPQHVLRFWESKFKQISPLKRGGGRRYYRPQDIDLIKRIHHLLHTQGYTIKGVQKLLVKDRQLLASVDGMDGQPARDANPVAKDIIQRINSTNAAYQQPANPMPKGPLFEGNAVPHASAVPHAPALSANKQAELQLILKRLKTLSTSMASRSN